MVLFTLVILFVAFFRRSNNSPPIFGVYSQKGKWYYMKYLLFLCLLYIRKWRSESSKKPKTDSELIEFDGPRQLSPDPNGFNAVFFIGANSDGWRFLMGLERRHGGIIHTVLYFLVPGRGVFKLPQLPDTMVFSTKEGEESSGFSAAGLFAGPKEAMKKWTIYYKGNLLHKGEILKNCSFDAEFSSSFGCMDYDTDLSPKAIATSIATEPWSRKYFDQLKTAHQSRIEQMGKIKAVLRLDSKDFELDLDGFRDLSYGNRRDWTLMHRYAFFLFFLDNGYKFSVIHVNQPCTGSSLKVGYVCTPAGEYIPIDNSDFELYQHGETTGPPKECAFQIETYNQKYDVEVKWIDVAEHFVGNNWEARMMEGMIDVKVNGINGYGTSEFHYNNKSGRPEFETDPLWFRRQTNKV